MLELEPAEEEEAEECGEASPFIIPLTLWVVIADDAVDDDGVLLNILVDAKGAGPGIYWWLEPLPSVVVCKERKLNEQQKWRLDCFDRN